MPEEDKYTQLQIIAESYNDGHTSWRFVQPEMIKIEKRIKYKILFKINHRGLEINDDQIKEVIENDILTSCFINVGYMINNKPTCVQHIYHFKKFMEKIYLKSSDDINKKNKMMDRCVEPCIELNELNKETLYQEGTISGYIDLPPQEDILEDTYKLGMLCVEIPHWQSNYALCPINFGQERFIYMNKLNE
jgi:hypothetical protein